VSSFTPVDYVVARLDADDPDSPANARLLYSVESGNERGLFHVDTSSGELSIASDALSQVDFDEFVLSVTVQEVGDEEVRSPIRRKGLNSKTSASCMELYKCDYYRCCY